MWRQRSKVLWLKEGDQNTRFFHKKTSHRRKKNLILRLKDESSTWQVGEGRDALIKDYFEHIFTASSKRVNMAFLQTLHGRVTSTMNENLAMPYTKEEVRAALREMNPSKAPGPDGMAPLFY